MDQHLRLLRRQAQEDPSLRLAYINALERAVGNLNLPVEVSVWVVVFCHGETSSDDVHVFATQNLAESYAMDRMVTDLKLVHQEGGCSSYVVDDAVTYRSSMILKS